MFDNICKFLAETYSTDIASWLLGEPIPLTQVQPQELAVEPIGAATYVLAGLVLDKTIIKQILRRDIMRESVTYQEILQEGLQEGRQQGRQEGRQEGRKEGRKEGLVAIVLRLLTHKFGTLSPKLHTRITRLHIPRLESLAEAILDFQSLADLELWFNKKK